MYRKSRRLRFPLLLLAVIASTTVLGAGSDPAASLGTVSYDVRYKLGGITTRVATATISWEEDAWKGIPAYHSKAVIEPTPVFRIFISSDYLAEVYFSRDRRSPLYFINPFKYGGKEGKYEYVFRADKKVIESTAVRGDAPPENTTFPLDGRTMDLLSLLHFVRFVELEGKPLEMNILMAAKSYAARLIEQGDDDEKFPGLEAEHILLQMTEHGLMENGSGNEIHIWRSSAPDRRLLGLEVALSSGRMICRIRDL